MFNQYPNLNCNCFTGQPTLIDGIPVEAATLQPLLDALYANDVFLKGVLDYFEMPSALQKCVPVNPAIDIGQPVYYDPVTEQYELAQYDSVISESGNVYLSETAEVWGLLIARESTDVGRILISGIYPVDISAALLDLVNTGKFYLSDQPGKLVPVPPDDQAPVYVLTATADGSVLFRPWSGEYAGLVLQWRHALLPAAAGTTVVADGKVSITSPNPALPGWLPAAHASFSGNAPAGAVFGYNVVADEDLADRWPPRFLNTVHFDLDRALDPEIGGTSVPVGVGGLVIADEHGIWWMSDCETDMPFDTAAVTPSAPGVCPRVAPKRLTMYAARPAGMSAADAAAMSLLSSHPALRFVRRGTSTLASNGNLDLTLDVSKLLLPFTDDLSGYAVKQPSNNQLSRGPIVTAVKSTNPRVRITGSEQYGDYHHGELLIDACGLVQQELLPLTTALDRAEEEVIYGTLGIGMPTRVSSGFRSKFVVPLTMSGPVALTFRVWIMAHFANIAQISTGTEQLTISAKVIPHPTVSTDVAATVEQALTIPVSTVENGKVFEQISSEIEAGPGAVVYVSLSRQPGNAAYELHALKHYLYVDRLLDPQPENDCPPCPPVL